jgi:hypothetical protein
MTEYRYKITIQAFGKTTKEYWQEGKGEEFDNPEIDITRNEVLERERDWLEEAIEDNFGLKVISSKIEAI